MAGRGRARVVVACLSIVLLWQGAATTPARAADPTPISSAPASPLAPPTTPPSQDPTGTGAPGPDDSPIETQAQAEAGIADRRPELVERRTETSRTFDNGDGTTSTEFYPDPIHYQPAGNANWEPIELKFAPPAAGSKTAKLTKSPVQVSVAPASDPAGFLSVTLKGHKIALRPGGSAKSTATPKIDGSRADIADVAPGIDLRVFASAEGVNAFFVLESEPVDPTFTFIVDAPSLGLTLDGGTQRIQLKNAKGELVGWFRAPYAVDSTPDEFTGGGRMTSAVTYSLSKIGGKQAVTVSVDPAWLASATYPVYVDPTIYNNGSSTYGDAHVNQGNPNFNYANYLRPDAPGYYEMWLGESPSDPSYYNEAYIKFDLSTIAGTTIDSATLEVRPYHQYYNAPTATTTWLRRVLNADSWTEGTITWNNKPGVNSVAVDSTGCVEGTQCAFAATSLVRGWLDGTYTNNGVRLDENGNGPTYWKRLIASEEQITSRPRLLVTNHVPTVTTTTPPGWTTSRTVAWSYADVSGHAQSHYEVDVSTVATFASFVYNGVETAGAATSFAIPAGTPLTEGATYYWRVRVKDGTSYSAYASSSFKLDSVDPTGSISIANGATYTATPAVTLNLVQGDATSLPFQHRFSNDAVWDTEPWEVVAATKAWNLTAGDGTKTVYYQVKDNAGRTSSTYSDTIILDTSPGTPTPPDAACAGTAVYQAALNATCFFRPAGASTMTLTGTVADPHSGIAYLSFQSLSPTTGWTPSPALPNNDTLAPYTQALAFNASAVSATIQLVGRNGAGLDTAIRTATLTADTAGPGATFTIPASGSTTQSSNQITATWSELDTTNGVTTPGSGVLSRSLKRQLASYSGGVCGTFSDDPAFTPTTATSPVSDTSLLVNTCYRYVQTLTDRVGNVLATTSGIVIRDTSANLGMQTQHSFETWDLGAGDGLAVNVANGNLVVSHPIVSLPIRGSSVDLNLAYNRHDSSDIGMGPGWRLDAFRRLKIEADGSVTFTDADGARHRFTNPQGTGTITYTRPAALYATLTRDTAATPDRFILTYRDQSQDRFDELSTGTGFLVREQDRHGNGVDLAYVATELRTITDTAADPDRIIDLTWTSGKLTRIEDWAFVDGSGVVQTSPSGSRRATRFFYDGSNRLAGWADPLNTTGACPTAGSHLTCVDYTSGLAITKTQTYATLTSGTLGTSTRPVTTAVTFIGSDVSVVKDAQEQFAGTTGTVFTRPSATEVQVVRKGSGTSQDTTTKYARTSASDAYARITSVKRKLGAAWIETLTTYDASHPVEVASVTEDAGGALSRTTSYTYVGNSMGLISRTIEPVTSTDDRWTDFVYNANNDLTSQAVSLEGAFSVTTRFCYAASGCSTAATDLLMRATIENYVDGIHGGTSGHVEDVTTEYGYDAYGERTSQTRHVYAAGSGTAVDHRVDTRVFDANGNHTNSIVNYDDGSVSGGTDVTPVSPTWARTDLTTTHSHDTAGNQISSADPRRAIHDIASTPGAADYLSGTRRDALGQALITVLPTTPGGATCTPDPACRTTTTTYDELGGARLVQNTDDSLTASLFDRAGRLLETFEDVDGAGGSAARQTSLQTTDPQGRTLTSKDDRQLDDVNLGQSTVTYDELGRATSSTVAAGGTSGDESTTATTFDAFDRVTAQTVGTESPDARTTTTSYDKGGRVVSVNDEFACTTSTYDHRDLALEIIEGRDPGSPCTGTGARTIGLTYDALGRLTNRSVGTEILEANTFDSVGRATKTWATEASKLRTTETWFNLLDEPLERLRYLQDGAVLSERSWSRTTRDAVGNETDRCTWDATPAEWCHPADDATWANPAPISRSSTGYDARNLRVRLLVPGESETTYDPGAGYQVDKVFVTTKVNASGQATAEHVTDHTYDSRDRLIGIDQSSCMVSAGTHACTDTPVLTGDTAYTYDDAGNRASVIEDNGSGAITRYYCYDARNQLTAVSTSSATCTAGVVETYAYDAAGNRTADGARTFGYTASGQLQSCASPTCGTPVFDDDGRMTGVTTSSGTWTYAYDDEGRLVAACAASSCAGTPAKLSMTYDGQGHRIRLVETTAGASPTVTTTDFTYQGDTVVREVETTGSVVVTRSFTTDDAGAIVKMAIATTPTAGPDDGTYLVTWNGHGDALAVSEIDLGTGVLTPAARMNYSTWGAPTVTSVNGYGPLGFRYLYVGRFDVQWDNFAGAGLTYMHARHYSPEFGRFLAPDPARADANLYGYAENGPVSKIDPTGEIVFCAIPFIGWAICAAAVRVIVTVTVRVAIWVLRNAPAVTHRMTTQVVRNMTKIKNPLAKADTWRQAAQRFPKIFGRAKQCHHIWPRYMGGPANYPRVLLDPAYHQMITNAFRARWRYGIGAPGQKKALEIMLDVYRNHPIDGFPVC